MDISLDIPSLCASKLSDGRADIGLIPVAAIKDVPNAKIISDFCIASSGKVRTVVLLSDVPLKEISKIILDYQSRTSVQLVQVLARYFWKITPNWEKGEQGYIENISDQTTAVVVIGDRVFEAAKKFKYCYDLGEEWKIFTGLDFVFACWISNKEIDIEFISEFNKALAYGLSHIEEMIRECEVIERMDELNEYFSKYIKFVLDDSKRNGLALFLKFCKEMEPALSQNF
jgi:chorismate dehydratase